MPLAVAWFQALWGVLVLTSGDRRQLLAALVVNAAVIALWVWSRTAGLPIGPHPGVPEAIGAADVISTALEAVIIAGTTLLLASLVRWREPSRGVMVGSAVLVWVVVIVLIVVAILAEAETASAGH